MYDGNLTDEFPKYNVGDLKSDSLRPSDADNRQ